MILRPHRTGFIDKTGEWVIPPVYDWANDFENGITAVKPPESDNTFIVIDKTGTQLFRLQALRIGPFCEEGLALVSREIRKYVGGDTSFINGMDKYGPLSGSIYKTEPVSWTVYGFIDRNGVEVIPCTLDFVLPFFDGLARVSHYLEPTQRYIDRTGKEVFSTDYGIEDLGFAESLLGVRHKGRCGFIDRSNNWVIKPKFNELNSGFINGLAMARKGSYWGFIDKAGKFVIRNRFSYCSAFSDGVAVVGLGDKTGLVDQHDNLIVLPFIEQSAVEIRFSDGLGVFRWYRGGDILSGYFDKNGDIAIPPSKFDGLHFTEGMAPIKLKDGTWTFIDKTGTHAMTARFRKVYHFQEGLARAVL